ncbi:nuclear transcription factor Y subunit A-7-like [Lotus japonicus]|uniref:nuclear transcription factor Y subunit A-7-like n=1 Tax=Lotus japonicus TaxID=34305 RepID=UPI00258446AD|nr:nuclear transcription factor Y subunit A-7-like [Lotus japonicus]
MKGLSYGWRLGPLLLLNHPDTVHNCTLVDNSHKMACAPYPYGDPFSGVSLVAYGPQVSMPGLASSRIALPLDLAEDGPIYVNAKQYHGILRRRQSRAKLEARNKLIKSRKPYLHESRHRHALNRVRGSGGRFLSAKQKQQSNAERVNVYLRKDASEVESHASRTGKSASSITNCSGVTSVSSNNVNIWQPELNFLGNSANMGAALHCSGGLSFGGGTQQCPVGQ